VLLVDAANVVGARPTGWWRDRPGAARRLVEEIRAAAAASRLPTPVIVVLEGEARRGAGEGHAAGVEVVHAPQAGDETLVALAARAPSPVVLVSADRALRDRVRAHGGESVGPRWLLGRLQD
jgi:hypothetical protein